MPCCPLFVSCRLSGHDQPSSGDELPVCPDGFHHRLCPARHHRGLLAHVFRYGAERASGLVEPQHEYPVILVGEMPSEELLYVPYQPVASGQHLFPFFCFFRAVRLAQSCEILVSGTVVTAFIPCARLQDSPVASEEIGFQLLDLATCEHDLFPDCQIGVMECVLVDFSIDEREDDFFPADPQGPALRSGGERLPLLQRNECVLFCFLPPAIILLR